MPDIRHVENPDTVRPCYPVMAQLRPHLTEDSFVAQVLRQFDEQQYHLVALYVEDVPAALAGYRLGECLFSGRYVYVDDLVTDEAQRSQGYGGQLFDWLVLEARRLGCASLQLDSGVQRFAAHRFYLAKRMDIASHHFSLSL